MQPRNNVHLSFESHRGEVVRLNIPRADMTLTEARVRDTMEAMIDCGIVLTAAGFPVSIKTAKIVQTTRAPLVAGA